ncbi:MAG: hypothetical protein QMD08_07770 [Actinomycetota bacterium]|nr:hypothetical protein [Actinomycetota bacterium]
MDLKSIQLVFSVVAIVGWLEFLFILLVPYGISRMYQKHFKTKTHSYLFLLVLIISCVAIFLHAFSASSQSCLFLADVLLGVSGLFLIVGSLLLYRIMMGVAK